MPHMALFLFQLRNAWRRYLLLPSRGGSGSIYLQFRALCTFALYRRRRSASLSLLFTDIRPRLS